jgi:hypothetical protein
MIMEGEVLGGKRRLCSGIGGVLWWLEKRHLFIGFMKIITCVRKIRLAIS